MPEVVFLVVRLAFLVLLWLFVLTAVRTIRLDIFGPRVPRSVRRDVPARSRRAPTPTASGAKAARVRAKRLLITEGSLAGTSVQLADAPITIGRAPDSTLVLTDDYVSTHHARLMPRDGQWVVEDLGSTNGTYLDRSKVTGPTPVPVGAKVRIGKTVLEMRK
ncbi:MAG: FHA domain-containing protein [Mycobacteriales bacterium]